MKIQDIKASLVVFLIALPLCLGIALASGAPVLSGLIAGALGGIIVGFLGGSEVSVSGPAAGLTVVVLSSIAELKSFEIFCLALICAGILQWLMGYFRGGKIANFFPSSVIEGMLGAIGLILILKQLPHAVGFDRDYLGDESFNQLDGENTFSQLLNSLQAFHWGATIISILSIGIIWSWDKKLKEKFKFSSYIPGALVAVVVSVFMNLIFNNFFQSLIVDGVHLVNMPKVNFEAFSFPMNSLSLDVFLNISFWKIVLVISLIASIETLLSLDAADKLDPEKRISNKDKELKAQGIGNMISGFLGGLPLTAVVVRTSANVTAGGYSRYSAIFHGVWIIVAVLFFTELISLIPLSALSGVLIVVGFKLMNPKLIKKMWKKGLDQFLPFAITVFAILLTDLLTGICIGMLVGVIFILKRSYHESILIIHHEGGYLVRFYQNISFLNKSKLKEILMTIPDEASVLIDGSRPIHVDEDIVDVIEDFMENAHHRGIKVTIQKSKLALSTFFREIA